VGLDDDVAPAGTVIAMLAEKSLLRREVLETEPNFIPLEAGNRGTVGGDNRIAGAGGAERAAHHGGVRRQRAAALLDGRFTKRLEVVTFENLKWTAVHVLDCRRGH